VRAQPQNPFDRCFVRSVLDNFFPPLTSDSRRGYSLPDNVISRSLHPRILCAHHNHHSILHHDHPIAVASLGLIDFTAHQPSLLLSSASHPQVIGDDLVIMTPIDSTSRLPLSPVVSTMMPVVTSPLPFGPCQQSLSTSMRTSWRWTRLLALLAQQAPAGPVLSRCLT
jgi:hypothetical protein